ncbi:Retrovirus-related Pol polyprotein from transposon TNT 1-94 [Dendrobium catenatum]|uniref:Retrovirus-related Pol polyprotein from transposon TNT 1-94 n=1 Tax=Dendrobium catenatum TaxID=906689 RepID=A0A2I0XA37_9ASPA|nr:Retrovirus-related Pol polyprotein from transposon TNT 1-94 [Dendrobium catenatum]
MPTVIFCDNTSAIAFANNFVFHVRTKHIEIDYHFISTHFKSMSIRVSHIHSEDQIVDLLIKSLSINWLQDL